MPSRRRAIGRHSCPRPSPSPASPVRSGILQVVGRTCEATKRFYSMIGDVTVKDLLIDGDRACALTRYYLQPSGRPAFESDVAEAFIVRDGKIANLRHLLR